MKQADNHGQSDKKKGRTTAGPSGTMTVELTSNGHRITVWADYDGIELVSKAKPEASSQAPKGGQKRLVPGEA